MFIINAMISSALLQVSTMLPSIHEVAKDVIVKVPVCSQANYSDNNNQTVLCENEPVTAFYIELDSHATLADHATDQRLIVSLSPLFCW